MPSDDKKNYRLNAFAQPILHALGQEQRRLATPAKIVADFNPDDPELTADAIARLPADLRDPVLDELYNAKRITMPQLKKLASSIKVRVAYLEEPDPPEPYDAPLELYEKPPPSMPAREVRRDHKLNR